MTKNYPLEFQLTLSNPVVEDFSNQILTFSTRQGLQIATEYIIYRGYSRYFRHSTTREGKSINFNSFEDFKTHLLNKVKIENNDE